MGRFNRLVCFAGGMMKTVKEKIEYDGYYLISATSKNGHKSTIPARGYNLKSWLNFEKSLGSEAVHKQVTEKEYMKYHWSGTPYVDEPESNAPSKKAVKKAVKKAPVNKAIKKATVKTSAKKAVKKAVKKVPKVKK